MGNKSFKLTIFLSLVNPFLLVAVGILAGGGHGTYLPAIVLFPTGMISFSLFDRITLPFIMIAVLQFPVYGLLIDSIENKGRVVVSIVVFHFLMMIFAFFFER